MGVVPPWRLPRSRGHRGQRPPHGEVDGSDRTMLRAAVRHATTDVPMSTPDERAAEVIDG